MSFRRVWVQGLGRLLSRHELRQLRSVWDAVPHVRCKGLCAAACKQVPLFPVEAFFLIEKRGAEIEPGTHPATLSKRGNAGNGEYFMAPTLGAGKPCQFLKEDRCSIYEDRPLICRLYGHPVGTLPCKYGCIVKNPLDPLRLGELMMRVVRILNPAVSKEPKTQDDFRLGFDALYRQWDDMTILAEEDEEATDHGIC